MFLRKLAISNFAVHRARMALTIAAIALAVSLVVAVTSGYKSAEGAAFRFLNQYLGTTDAQITRLNDPHGGVREDVMDVLRRDPQVRRVTGRLETVNGLVDAAGKPIMGHFAQLIGIVRPDDTRVDRLIINEGAWFTGADGDVAVVDQAAAEAMSLKLGTMFQLPGLDRQLRLKVVAIVHKPGILASQIQTIYLPLHTLQRFAAPGKPPQVTRIMIELASGVDQDDWQQRWDPKLKAIDPTLKLRMASDTRKQLDTNLQGVHMLSYIGGTVSLLAATFIVFSALSMGVTERTRTLAMLRAIGTLRFDIGKLVVAEGLILALIGAAIGAPLGWLWVRILVAIPKFHELLSAGVVIDWPGMAMGVGGSLLAALAASLLPAWSATRVSPLEAMNPLAFARPGAIPLRATLAGIFLIAIDPLMLWVPIHAFAPNPPSANIRAIQFYSHFVLGLPGVMIGFFLLAPLFVFCVERIFVALVATMLRIQPALVRQQLSTGIWRVAGTCAALMVGLAILVVMQVQGHTMLNGWKLPDKFPDIFIVAPSALNGFTEKEQRKLEDIPGIKRGEVMPIAIASPQFGSSMLGLVGAALIPDATMFFGVDPDRALKMMELDFREGNPNDAVAALKKGRHLIVTDEFRQLKGLHVGDKLPLKTARHGVIDYTICGVVWSPGIDVIVDSYDMGRMMDQRTAASVFGSLADAKEDFGVDRVILFAANLDYFVGRDEVLDRVQQALGKSGMRAGDIRQIKYAIQTTFYRLLLLLSSVAFAAMAVSSLGVTNTIMASIRTRRWQLGILRSIGVTQSQLLRLIFAEAILIGFAGCALGLAAGAEMSLNARALSSITIGYVPPPTVPWGMIWLGVGIVMFISLAASLWPAISVSRTEPLTLLQAGRAAA